MAMQMENVGSSFISQIGYDAEHKIIRVIMKSGATFEYENRSQKDFDAFRTGDGTGGSVGRWFNTMLRGQGAIRA